MLDYGGPGGQWSSPPHFMKDGYNQWAESSAPAREGGAEKTPSMKEMPKDMRGGNSLLEKAKGLYDGIKDAAPMIHKVLKNPTVRTIVADRVPGNKDPKKGPIASSGREIFDRIRRFMTIVGLKDPEDQKEGSAMMRKVGASKEFKQWCKEEEKEHEGRHESESESESDEEHGGRTGGVGRKSELHQLMDAEGMTHGRTEAKLLRTLAKKKGLSEDEAKDKLNSQKAAMRTHGFTDEQIGYLIDSGFAEKALTGMDDAEFKEWVRSGNGKGGRIGMGEHEDLSVKGRTESQVVRTLMKKKGLSQAEAKAKLESQKAALKSHGYSDADVRELIANGSAEKALTGMKAEAYHQWVKEGNGVPADWVDQMKEKARKEGGRIGMGREADEDEMMKMMLMKKGGRIGMGKSLRLAEKCGGDLNRLSEKERLQFIKGAGLVKRGGKSLLELGSDIVEKAVAAVEWFFLNKDKIKEVLGSPVFNKVSKQVLDAVDYPNRPEKPGTWLKDKMESVGLGHRHGMGDSSAYLSGGVGRDTGLQHFSASVPAGAYRPLARLNNLAPDSDKSWLPSSSEKKGGRKPSAYALFVKEYAKKHPGLGKSLMKEAAAAWKQR